MSKGTAFAQLYQRLENYDKDGVFLPRSEMLTMHENYYNSQKHMMNQGNQNGNW